MAYASGRTNSIVTDGVGYYQEKGPRYSNGNHISFANDLYRNQTWSNNIEALRNGKYISADAKESDFLVSTIALIARFWISEAAISFKNQTEEEQLQHYTNMIARIFLPFTTAKGKRELEEWLTE